MHREKRAAELFRLSGLLLVFLLAPLLLGQKSGEQGQPTAPSAEAPPALTEKDLVSDMMQVSVWPEYDDPRVLAIFRGSFDPSTFKPTQVGFYLPPMAEVIGAGHVSDTGELLLNPYQVVPEEQGDRLILTLPQRRFFLEYYYQAFGPEANRSFTYELPITFAVKNLEVRIQRPLNSTNFSIQPPSSRIFTDGQGFQYYGYQFSDLKPGTRLSLAVSYTKTDPSPSVSRQPMPPVPQEGPPPVPTRGGAFAKVRTPYMPYLLGGLVVVGVGLIVLWAMGRVPGLARRELCEGCERMVPTSHQFCPYCGKSRAQEEA